MTLEALNKLSTEERKNALHSCYGSVRWTEKLSAYFPFKDEEELFEKANTVLQELEAASWLEAFSHHPKIGDLDAARNKFAASAHWTTGEQSGVNDSDREILGRLAELNLHYERRFGYIFIVCATGKSAAEMLGLLEDRLHNDPAKEFCIAAGEQRKITLLRLKKLLSA